MSSKKNHVDPAISSGSSPTRKPAIADRFTLAELAACGTLLFDADSTRKRGKALSRRIGQNGSIEIRNGMYRGRYLVDVPGEERRKNKAVILGLVSEMTKSEARRKLKSVIAAEGLNEPSYAIPSSELFKNRVTNWRTNYLARQKPSTQATMDSHIEKHLLPKWGEHAIDSIREKAVDEWIAVLSALAPSTQRGIVKTLQTVLGKCFDKKLIHFPSELVARRQHPCHTPEQMQRIVASAREPYNVLFAIAAETGMRSGEIYGLHVEDVDPKRLLIHVRRSVWRGKPQSPKSQKAYRGIDIRPELAKMILKHLNGRKTGYVFQTRLGTPFKHPRVLKRVLYPLLKRLGIPKSGMHAFRHGRVTYLVECNTPIETIRAWIGHGSDEMVKLYTHLRPEYRKRILDTIPALIHPVHPELETGFSEQVA
jgi:integrase